MHIDVWSDVACPWCYLGLARLRLALRAFPREDATEVRLHAFLLDPELEAVSELSEAEYLRRRKGIGADRVAALHGRLEREGRPAGLRFRFERVVVAPTSNAHRLISLAHDLDAAADTLTGPDTTQLRTCAALQRAHFERGLDVSDPEVLAQIGQGQGIDPQAALAALADESRASEVFSDFQIGAQMGVTSVPTLLIDNRFVVEGAQSEQAYANVLATAWNSGNPRERVPVPGRAEAGRGEGLGMPSVPDEDARGQSGRGAR